MLSLFNSLLSNPINLQLEIFHPNDIFHGSNTVNCIGYKINSPYLSIYKDGYKTILSKSGCRYLIPDNINLN